MTSGTLIEILVGVILAVIAIYPFRKANAEFLKKYFAATLIIAALIYVGFAIFGLISGSADPFWLLIEFGGVLFYSIFAYFGFRKTALLLASGWALHIVWDAGLHWSDKIEFVPQFYPGVCIGFDIAFAAFIFYRFFIARRD